MSISSHPVQHLKETLFSLNAYASSILQRCAHYGFLLKLIRYGGKNSLIRNIQLMQNEHFGIVLLEAMAAQKPVIARNSGGLVETITNGVTGYLCDPTPLEFSLAMAKFIQNPQMAERMGIEARRHVTVSFSTRIFGEFESIPC